MELIYCKIGKGTKRISLQRYLLTKLVEELEKFTNYDLFCLFENQLWLERKCLTDNDFCTKFGINLGGLSKLLKEMNLSKDVTPQSLRRLSTRVRADLSELLIPLRNYKSFKARFAGSFQILPAKQPGIPTSALPPKRYIGKGYGDKGTLKKEEDGSPSWQELSSAFRTPTNEELEDLFHGCQSFTELENAFCNLFFGKPKPLVGSWMDHFRKTPVDPETIRKIGTSQKIRDEYFKD